MWKATIRVSGMFSTRKWYRRDLCTISNNLTTEIDLMGEWGFARFEFKMSSGGCAISQQPPVSIFKRRSIVIYEQGFIKYVICRRKWQWWPSFIKRGGIRFNIAWRLWVLMKLFIKLSVFAEFYWNTKTYEFQCEALIQSDNSTGQHAVTDGLNLCVLVTYLEPSKPWDWCLKFRNCNGICKTWKQYYFRAICKTLKRERHSYHPIWYFMTSLRRELLELSKCIFGQMEAIGEETLGEQWAPLDTDTG